MAPPVYDPACYLCPDNERANGARNDQYVGTFVFDNDFPAFQSRASSAHAQVGDLSDELLVARDEAGRCRVVCFSPRHDLTLADLPVPDIRRIVDTWAEEYGRLGADADIAHVQIFENKGESMGCSNPHPHGQIWAQSSIPFEVAREGERLLRYHERHRRTLLEDYLALESSRRERIVCENDAWVAMVPFWAVWPFETLLVSRRPVRDLDALRDVERGQLAEILKTLTTAYDRLFDVSFPYTAGFHQAPTDGADHPEWHLHMHFYPPLLRSASVRKFLVGYEMLAEAQRDLTPEAAAERLRQVGCARSP